MQIPNYADLIANAIRRQIGINTLMSLGASDLHTVQGQPGSCGLAFSARILAMRANGTRGTRARVMNVKVLLNGNDLYDIKVTYPKSLGSAERVTHFERSDVYASKLSATLFALDYDGDEVLNPRMLVG